LRREHAGDHNYFKDGSDKRAEEADTIVYPNASYHGIVGLSIGIEKAKKNIAAGAKIIRRAHLPFMWPEIEEFTHLPAPQYEPRHHPDQLGE
jgi:hypothetical protein